jgi:hypothetical protein
MPLNLVQHRGEASVWDQGRGKRDPERWLGAAVAGVCLVSGFRRRTSTGWLMVVAGASLAWWAAAGMDERQNRRDRLKLVWPLRRGRIDPVDEALEESFPASDATSFAGTIGNGIPGEGSHAGAESTGAHTESAPHRS